MNIEKEAENFCKNIARIRRRNGLTQKEMAAALGIAVGTLRKIEKGVFPQKIKIGSVLKLYDIFHILPSSLLEEEYEKTGRANGSP